MKQVVQSLRNGQITVLDVPLPETPSRGYLVRVARTALSPGTERMTAELAKKSLVGKALERPDLVRKVVKKLGSDGIAGVREAISARLDAPQPVGYSAAGVVFARGVEATGLREGDRVACAGAGIANHAEWLSVPERLAVRIPDPVSDDDACFATVGAIAMQGVRILRPEVGEVVAVVGLGLIGQLTVQILRSAGCRVIGIDPVAARVALSKRLGADLAVTQAGGDLDEAAAALGALGGFDGVIVTAATKSGEPMALASRLCRKRGRISVVGAVGMELDRREIYRKELEVRMSTSYGPGRYDPEYEVAGHDYPAAYVRWTEQRNLSSFLDLVALGKVQVAPLVTHRIAAAKAGEAYALLDDREAGALGIVLEYPPAGEPVRTIEIPRVSGASGRSSADAKRAGVGLVGAGLFARSTILPILQKAGARLVSVASERGLSARAAGDRFAFARAVAGAEEVIGDKDVDAVFVLTPHGNHAALAAKILGAGKAAWVEKPLAIRVDELDGLVEALGKSDRLTVGFNRRFAPAILEARNFLARGGGPVSVMIRVAAGELPADHWQLDPKVGGGRLLGEGCHFIDLASYLAGSRVVRVSGSTSGQPGKEAIHLLLEMERGNTAVIACHAVGDPALPKEWIEVSAGGRTARIDDYKKLTLSGGKGAGSKSWWTRDKGHAELVRRFLDAVRTGGPMPIPVGDILASTAATLAAAEAVAAGAPRVPAVISEGQ